MNKIKMFLFILAAIVLYWFRFELVCLLNSHLGSNISVSESDTTLKTQNIISFVYDYMTSEMSNNYAESNPNNEQWITRIPSVNVSELTPNKFKQLTNGYTTPLVIKGVKCEAIKKWNLDFFEQKYGRTLLPVISDGDTKNHHKYVQTQQVTYSTQTLTEIIQAIKENKKLYLNNVSRIFGYHPELLDDLSLENIQIRTGIDLTSDIHVTNMFMGARGTGSSLHCSITGNIFCNIKGRKKWQLIDPCYSNVLRPKLSRTGLFAVSQFDLCDSTPNDYIAKIPRYEYTLEEGDVLFNPPWWWHAVTNTSEYTIACANRFTDFWVGFKNNPLFTLIFASHPFANYNDFAGTATTREEANVLFDKALLRDIGFLEKDESTITESAQK